MTSHSTYNNYLYHHRHQFICYNMNTIIKSESRMHRMTINSNFLEFTCMQKRRKKKKNAPDQGNKFLMLQTSLSCHIDLCAVSFGNEGHSICKSQDQDLRYPTACTLKDGQAHQNHHRIWPIGPQPFTPKTI